MATPTLVLGFLIPLVHHPRGYQTIHIEPMPVDRPPPSHGMNSRPGHA